MYARYRHICSLSGPIFCTDTCHVTAHVNPNNEKWRLDLLLHLPIGQSVGHILFAHRIFNCPRLGHIMTCIHTSLNCNIRQLHSHLVVIFISNIYYLIFWLAILNVYMCRIVAVVMYHFISLPIKFHFVEIGSSCVYTH